MKKMNNENIADVLLKYINGILSDSEMTEIKLLIQTNPMYEDAYIGLKKMLQRSSMEDVQKIVKFIQKEKENLLGNSERSFLGRVRLDSSKENCITNCNTERVNSNNDFIEPPSLQPSWKMLKNESNFMNLPQGSIIMYSSSEITKLSKLDTKSIKAYCAMLGIKPDANIELSSVIMDNFSSHLNKKTLRDSISNSLNKKKRDTKKKGKKRAAKF